MCICPYSIIISWPSKNVETTFLNGHTTLRCLKGIATSAYYRVRFVRFGFFPETNIWKNCFLSEFTYIYWIYAAFVWIEGHMLHFNLSKTENTCIIWCKNPPCIRLFVGCIYSEKKNITSDCAMLEKLAIHFCLPGSGFKFHVWCGSSFTCTNREIYITFHAKRQKNTPRKLTSYLGNRCLNPFSLKYKFLCYYFYNLWFKACTVCI